ncbi:FtsJ-like methyltransferase-domain-containing protein [Daldinia vernicosa]|uniref:FtsJ-like methyltransferase-domain-containing protein n=1 Tax=Daldinia vernicosa TaxID=114800 RepID=UPI0020074540|nr:FtsJ-like methyltransferase-domain-containing protein [Daldinia vernicosa]KAI0853235.1 FtsJ-like methyltransferase-domain-containing protein [Daldinia vernicosa]
MQALARIATPRNGRLLGAIATRSSGVLSLFAQPASKCIRWSSSNSRWLQRQGNDYYRRQALVQNYRGRAAFKLLSMDTKYKLFKRGQTVIDLGYAPGSWSQVALDRTKPKGRIVGIDIIPAQPPKGVSTIQGDFLSPSIQQLVKDYLIEYPQRPGSSESDGEDLEEEGVIMDRPSYIDVERAESHEPDHELSSQDSERLVDVVLSDMSEPWPQTSGFSIRTLTHAYRMMNTSGMRFRDHAGSMDLCHAALQFASDTLKADGHFVCKFYQGSEDKELEKKLRKMFHKVHREKPDSSRDESPEMYFVALRRKGDVTLSSIEGH